MSVFLWLAKKLVEFLDSKFVTWFFCYVGFPFLLITALGAIFGTLWQIYDGVMYPHESPVVMVTVDKDTVSFTVTGDVVGKHEAVPLIHEEIFRKWNKEHPDKQFWQINQKVTVTFTFDLPPVESKEAKDR